MRMTVNGTGNSALLAKTYSHSDYHLRWLGIDFRGNLHSWSSGCMTSNVWIAEVVEQEKNSGKESMTSLQEFRCEICGTLTSNPTHWFVIQCGDSALTVLKWNAETANAAGARHFCGE